jgi:hypothetical protein
VSQKKVIKNCSQRKKIELGKKKEEKKKKILTKETDPCGTTSSHP